jgi:hypothetical protein
VLEVVQDVCNDASASPLAAGMEVDKTDKVDDAEFPFMNFRWRCLKQYC